VTQSHDKASESEAIVKTRAICPCRLCLALDEADAWIADHGGSPAQAARHLARRYLALLNPARFRRALYERRSFNKD